jgi:hypothetical protein
MSEVNAQMRRDFKKLSPKASEEEIDQMFEYYTGKMREVGLGEED